jgi:hypothetical protein
MNNFQRNFAEAQNQGTVDEFAQMLYQKNADKTFGRLGYTGSDIVDKRSVDKYKTESVDQVAKDKADGAIKLLDEIGRVSTNSASGTLKKAELGLTGTATSSTDEFVINNKKAALETLNSIPVQRVPGMEDINARLNLLPKGNFKNNFSETAGTNRDLYGSLIRMNNFEEAVGEKDAQIKTVKSKLSSAKNAEEKKMYSAQLTSLAQDKEEIRLALADDTKTLENLIKIELNNKNADPIIKELYNQTLAKGDTQGFVRGLRTEVQNYINKQSIEIGSTGREVSKNGVVEFADKVMRNYRANIQTPFNAVGQEVILNASSDKFTDNKTKELREYVASNTRGSSQVRQVEFNILNGTSKEIGENKFDLSAYHAEPHWVGNDQQGHIIMRYVLKPEYDPATKKSNGPIASYIKKQKGLPEDSPKPPTPAEIKAWNDANPTNLYISVKDTSLNPAKSAEANYIKIGDAGIAYNNPDVVIRNLQNYAPLHVLQDNDRRKAYYSMTARLDDAIRNNYVGTELVQAPAAWKNNQDGTYTGYSITYKVVQGQVMAMVNEGTLGSNLEVTWKPEPVASVQLSSMGQNLTTALVSMDLMYGTGREEDLVQVQRGWGQVPFVPAFENPGAAKMPGSNYPSTYRARY